jgi:hypothetical protein
MLRLGACVGSSMGALCFYAKYASGIASVIMQLGFFVVLTDITPSVS